VLKKAALGFVVIGVAALLASCDGTKEQASDVVVPDLIGKNAGHAQTLLGRRGLRWRWEDGAQPGPANGFFMADTIVGQAPAVGQRVKPGTVVILVPSSDKIVAIPPG